MREYFVWLFKFLTFVAVIFVILPIFFIGMMAAAGGVVEDGSSRAKKDIAVIELKGIIENSKDILNELYKQSANDKVKGIVLRIDSPGGAVGPSQEIFSAVSKLKNKKPIVVSMGTVAASGGLYSALGASKIFAEPGTITGSIGVILQFPNLSRLAEQFKFDMVTIKSGKLKDVGNMFRPMTDDERTFLETTITTAYKDFVKAVVDGRKLKEEDVLKFADGRIILGSQAKDLHLIDDIGNVYDAARSVYELTGHPIKEDEVPGIFYPADKFGALKDILESASKIPALLSERHLELRYVMQ